MGRFHSEAVISVLSLCSGGFCASDHVAAAQKRTSPSPGGRQRLKGGWHPSRGRERPSRSLFRARSTPASHRASGVLGKWRRRALIGRVCPLASATAAWAGVTRGEIASSASRRPRPACLHCGSCRALRPRPAWPPDVVSRAPSRPPSCPLRHVPPGNPGPPATPRASHQLHFAILCSGGPAEGDSRRRPAREGIRDCRCAWEPRARRCGRLLRQGRSGPHTGLNFPCLPQMATGTAGSALRTPRVSTWAPNSSASSSPRPGKRRRMANSSTSRGWKTSACRCGEGPATPPWP